MVPSCYGPAAQYPYETTIAQATSGSIGEIVKTEIPVPRLRSSDCDFSTQGFSFPGLENAYSDGYPEEENTPTITEGALGPKIKLEDFDSNLGSRAQEPACREDQQDGAQKKPSSLKASSDEVSVTAIDVLSRQLNIDIQARLLEYPCGCLASTDDVPPARCPLPSADENKQRVLAALDALLELKITPQKMSFVEELCEFIGMTFCHKYHSWRAKETLRIWCLDACFKSCGATTTPLTKDMLMIQDSMALLRSKLIKNAKTTEVVRYSNDSDTIPNHQDTHRIPPTALYQGLYPITVWPRNLVSPVQRNVRKVSKKPLTPRGLRTGNLYVYRLVGLPGEREHYKIGYTCCVSVWQRVKQWEKRCGHKTEIIYPSTTSEGLKIKHVQRLEQIVHADLKIYQRHEEYCRLCSARRDKKKGRHREWFKTCDYRIKAVIRKWRTWIEQCPYQEINGVWQLKEEYEKQLDSLCATAQDFCNC